MLSLILCSLGRLDAAGLPEEIPALFADNFGRIARNIARDADPPGFYLYPGFSKELAICTMRLIPAGVQKVHLHGLPRRDVLPRSPRGLLRSLGRLASLGGFQPLYEMHTDSRDVRAMAQFHPAGWARFYQRAARLLERNPGVRGLFGSSWFFDPALAEVSPELAYLRTLVTDHGGWLVCLGACDRAAHEDALLRSPRRKEWFEQGRYHPRKYLVVWPRRELIAWAGRSSAAGPGAAGAGAGAQAEPSARIVGHDGARSAERPGLVPSGKAGS
jgi:hypothetical protein